MKRLGGTYWETMSHAARSRPTANSISICVACVEVHLHSRRLSLPSSMSPSFASARINVFEPSNVAAEFRRATFAFRVSSTFSGEYRYTVISGVMSATTWGQLHVGS